MAKELARTLHLVVAVVTAVTLAACGGAGGTASRGETASPRASSPAPETGTIVRGRTAATAASPPSTAAAVSPQSPVSAAIAGLSFDYTSFPQSRTSEGYFVLGQPDAPVLIQYYSDFL